MRLTFTSKNEVETTTATYETANLNTEQSQYVRMNNAKRITSSLFDRTNGVAPTTTPGEAQRLNGSTNERYGIARSLSVMPGDVVHAEVYAKYVDTNSSNWTGALTTLMSQIAANTAGVVVDGVQYTQSTASFPAGFAGLQSTTDNGAPRAYLNWLVFDRNYAFITGGFKQITTAAKEAGTDVAHELIAMPAAITITQPGYVYIYLSNESSTLVEVFFDEFKVTHTKSPVIQTDDYYPFGSTFNSYSRENSTPNQYQYNGKEKQDELGLDWLDYGARMYMSDIGRWGVNDPLAEEYISMSPYNYAANSPVVFIDPDGRRLYFSAGAGHDPGNTGYIQKMLQSFATHGNIYLSRDIDAHARPLMGIPRDALWSTGEYSQRPYYNLNDVSSTMGGDGVVSNVSEDNVNWRIKSTVEQINQDLEDNPLMNNEQFNLTGYSTGSVIMAQSALMLAKQGKTIDNLVLIGATFDNNSELYQALAGNENIKNIIRIDIPGDNVIEGVGALQSFLEKGDNHPHFKYAFGDNADENRKALSMILQSLGVGDFKKEDKDKK